MVATENAPLSVSIEISRVGTLHATRHASFEWSCRRGAIVREAIYELPLGLALLLEAVSGGGRLVLLENRVSASHKRGTEGNDRLN